MSIEMVSNFSLLQRTPSLFCFCYLWCQLSLMGSTRYIFMLVFHLLNVQCVRMLGQKVFTFKNVIWATSGQHGGIGRHTLSRTTKRRITTNLKTKKQPELRSSRIKTCTQVESGLHIGITWDLLKILMPAPIPRKSVLISMKCDLGIRIFKT